jgi:SAM-dependent methyltransferase
VSPAPAPASAPASARADAAGDADADADAGTGAGAKGRAEADTGARSPDAPHESAPPSDWVVRWAPLLSAGARVLDLACGQGRHVRWLAAAGHRVTAVDREAALLAPLARLPNVERTVVADLEAAPWPLPGVQFDAVLVTNYLWRALFPDLLDAVAPGGLLVYETFGLAQAALGRPRRPEFLLRPGELLERVGAGRADAPWRVIAFEEGLLPARAGVPGRAVQRIVARRLVNSSQSSAAAPDLLAAPG